MRLSRRPEDPDQPLGRFDRGRVFVMLFRGEYWQCGFLIPKGGYDAIKERGLESFREEIVAIAPLMKDRVAELRDWNQIRLLTVAVDRLRRWYRPGLLCIGDAAHAMSPIGGAGQREGDIALFDGRLSDEMRNFPYLPMNTYGDRLRAPCSHEGRAWRAVAGTPTLDLVAPPLVSRLSKHPRTFFAGFEAGRQAWCIISMVGCAVWFFDNSVRS